MPLLMSYSRRSPTFAAVERAGQQPPPGLAWHVRSAVHAFGDADSGMALSQNPDVPSPSGIADVVDRPDVYLRASGRNATHASPVDIMIVGPVYVVSRIELTDTGLALELYGELVRVSLAEWAHLRELRAVDATPL